MIDGNQDAGKDPNRHRTKRTNVEVVTVILENYLEPHGIQVTLIMKSHPNYQNILKIILRALEEVEIED